MISICCTVPKPDYHMILSHEEYQEFCRFVHQLRNKGYRLEEAQDKAYHQILSDSIPFN